MIRAVHIAELPALEDVAREFHSASRVLGACGFRIERFREVWTALLHSGAGAIFAYEDAGELAGVIGGMVHREIYGEALVATEFFWFVRAGRRGAGVALYRRFEEWARGQGAASIQMVHLFDSMPDKLARFYAREGFEPMEMRYSKPLTAARALNEDAA